MEKVITIKPTKTPEFFYSLHLCAPVRANLKFGQISSSNFVASTTVTSIATTIIKLTAVQCKNAQFSNKFIELQPCTINPYIKLIPVIHSKIISKNLHFLEPMH